jgi:hypothetical protein
MIKKQGNKFVVTNKAGTKVLGTHPSKEKAQKQLAAIEISKAKHMHENKSFKSFRSTLNESEYSEVLTGYGNRSAHKDDAGLHHLQSAGALAGINAMLATISKGTYLDPNEAFLKMKVRLNVVQLDFPWKPGSWDGGVGSFDIPVVQFGRVDGYDAQTGQIRFDGKANPTGGYTELNLHVEVGLNADSLYTVSAKLTPAVPVAEEVEVAEDYQTPTREREMDRKIAKHDDAADSAYRTRMTKYGKVADRASKSEDKHDKAIARLLKRSQKEQESSRTYGRSGKLVKRGSRAEVKEEMEQIDELNKKTLGSYIRKASSDLARKTSDADLHNEYMGDVGTSKARLAQERKKISQRKRGIGQAVSRLTTEAHIGKSGFPTQDERTFRDRIRLGAKLDKTGQTKGAEKRAWHALDKWAQRKAAKKNSVKEETEQIDEAGAAKLARMGYAYDRARVGARGVLNPERKKQMGDAYYKQREKVEANKAKRVAAGKFDKGRELEALHKKYEIRRAKNTVKEALIGGQKKLDLNKNKRLDSQDFAMLRAKKKAMSEAKKPMIKIGLNPNKKIGYEVASIGAGGKKTVEKSVDYTMPHVLRDTKKKGVNEAKMKTWTPRLDRLMANRDAVRSRPKKSILTQKVQDGKKMGAARPIAKYEGK